MTWVVAIKNLVCKLYADSRLGSKIGPREGGLYAVNSLCGRLAVTGARTRADGITGSLQSQHLPGEMEGSTERVGLWEKFELGTYRIHNRDWEYLINICFMKSTIRKSQPLFSALSFLILLNGFLWNLVFGFLNKVSKTVPMEAMMAHGDV